MDIEEFADRIEHTILGPETTLADVTRILDESMAHGLRACIPPCYVAEADAAFVKTATGFSEGGATVEDVKRMAEYLPVKASGGIRSLADAEAMVEAGAERIGTSSGVAIAEELEAR